MPGQTEWVELGSWNKEVLDTSIAPHSKPEDFMKMVNTTSYHTDRDGQHRQMTIVGKAKTAELCILNLAVCSAAAP
eukprot:2194824-Amphidinium_carterae.5